MKYFVSILTLLCYTCIFDKVFGQVVINPVFDKTDIPSFRVEKVELTSDTTYVYCSFQAEEGSWASISKDTYLEDVATGTRFPLIKSTGLPFSPDTRTFEESDTIQVLVCFPKIQATKFNFIEDENSHSFNIYGINLEKTFNSSYTDMDIDLFFEKAQSKKEGQDWESAIFFTLNQLEASKYVYGELSVPCSWAMFNLTMQYFETKEYEKVIEWGEKAIDILSVAPQDSTTLDVLARAYGNVGSAYQLLKQNEKASQYLELSLATRRLGEGIGTLNYVEYLAHLAQTYYYEDNCPKALLYGKEVALIYEKKYNENYYKYGCVYVNSLNNLCEFYQCMEQYEDAVYCGLRALKLIEKGVCEEIPWLKNAVYNNYASALSYIGKNDEAISYLERSIDSHDSTDRTIISSKMLLADILLNNKQDTINAVKGLESILKILEDGMAIGENDYPIYTGTLSKLYQLHKKRDYLIGNKYFDRLKQVVKEWQGEESVAYGGLLLESVRNELTCTALDNNNDSLLLDLEQSSAILKRHLNSSIYTMSTHERKAYWGRFSYVYTWLIPYVSNLLETERANSLAYDASLFFKGMLLSSEKEFKDMVLSSNDSLLIKLFKDYISNMSLLEEECTRNPNSNLIDSLKPVIQNQEFLLSQSVSRYNRQYSGKNISWKEVQAHLKEGDVAIEIVSFDIDSITYYNAYIINNKSVAPQLVFLFYDSGKLKEQVRSHAIDYERLSMHIWGNNEMNEALKGAKNIYFSASGLFNTIGIEYLPITNNQYIFDKYNIYRLSSTRELCYANSAIRTKKVCLYGGLDYNTINTSATGNSKQAYRLTRIVEDSIVKRGGFDPLFGSIQEINQIKEEIEKKDIKCSVFIGSEGTEESFKNLSGKQANIIHLSTHGMYIPDDDSQITNNVFHFLLSGETPNLDEDTQSLSRSFLVMSGGNMLIRRDSIPEGKDDGILTALEISHLDFNDLDLVVLSACQTALGRVTSEGVYGLQRSFKKAGANTILMSLDKVDDEATQILMVEFYKNLMAGKSKHQSLKDAQKCLREFDNGKYAKPEYWASFIMLDGLN